MLKGKDEVDAPKVQDNIFVLQPKVRTAPNIFDRKLVTSAETSQTASKPTLNTQVSFQQFDWLPCICRRITAQHFCRY